MGLFDFFQKKNIELTGTQQQWNKMWDLWAKGQVDSPYAELMTYAGEINNGGHDQYFTNLENTSDLQKELRALQTVLPFKLKSNVQRAYKAYLALEEAYDEKAEGILESCDNVFYEHEEQINRILEEYSAKIEL